MNKQFAGRREHESEGVPWAAGEPDSAIIAALDLVGGRSANFLVNLGELFGELFD